MADVIERLKERASQILRRASDESIRAQVVGALFILGALLSALTMIFPHPDAGQLIIWGVVVVASVIGVALLHRREQISNLAFHLAVAMGSLLINVLMLAADIAAGVYAAMFNWVILVIVNFFTPRQAIAHFAWMMGLYAGVLAIVGSSAGYSPLSRWLVATFALAVTGSATGWLVFRRRLAEESARRFLDLSQEMLCTIGRDGRFAKLNPIWSRTFGYSDAELCAKPVTNLIHPADQAVAELAFSRLRRGGPTELFENRCRDIGGNWTWLRWSASYSHDEELIYARVRPMRRSSIPTASEELQEAGSSV
jgi:PAS domain S-box-containing protein